MPKHVKMKSVAMTQNRLIHLLLFRPFVIVNIIKIKRIITYFSFYFSLTLAPIMLKCGMVDAETDAVTSAVKMEIMLIPVMIQKTQNIRPGAQFGLRSP